MPEVKTPGATSASKDLSADQTQPPGTAFAKAAILTRGRGGSLGKRTLRTGLLAQGMKATAQGPKTPE